MLTSTYPFANGIEDNAAELGPEAMTLATLLKSHGYSTGAFVGGLVLDQRFGLSGGFDVYDSPLDLHGQAGKDPSEIKRRGEDVTRSAEEWLSHEAHAPFFLFLHLYDLHTPYEIPKASLPGTSGYDVELSYVDNVLGGFWALLRQHDLLANTLVIFTSDHGESLGEHGETTHGYFIYQSTLHVPLIFHWPARPDAFPARIDEPVSLLDVSPTVVQYLGLEAPPRFQGQSLLNLLDRSERRPEEEIYSESLYAHDHFRTAPLRALRVGQYQYIEAPRAELYDLGHDPGETHDLSRSKPALAHTLSEHLTELRSMHAPKGAGGAVQLSPEAVERLRALGYLVSGASRPSSSDLGPDPKDRIAAFEAYGRALIAASAGHLAEADESMKRLLAAEPDLIEVRLSLGLDEQKLGQHQQAVQAFREVLRLDPVNALAHFNLGVSEYALKRPDDAVKELEAVLAIAPYYTRAEELLGTISLQKHDYSLARAQFKHVLTVDPNDYAAHYNLGVLAVIEKHWEEGEKELRAAVKSDPAAAEAHNTLGSLYLQLGRLGQAQQELDEAVQLQPKFAWAHYNLGLLLHEENKDSEALREFRLAEQTDPSLEAAREAAQKLETPQR